MPLSDRILPALIRAGASFHARRRGLNVTTEGGAIAIRNGDRVIRIAQRHLVYVFDMVRHFDVYWGAVVPADEGGQRVVDYSTPRIQTYVDSGLSFWLNAIAEEPDAVRAYFEVHAPAAGDTVFDVGANCGVSTYFLSQAVGPDGRVVAFEPDPENFALLERNIALHGLGNVLAVPRALGGRSGSRMFNSEGALGSGFSDLTPRGGLSAQRAVEVVTFPEACELAGGVPSYVKIDVEGAEVEIVESISTFLRDHRILFVIDTNHRIDGKFTASAVENAFHAAGYVAWSSEAYGFLTTWAAPSPPAS